MAGPAEKLPGLPRKDSSHSEPPERMPGLARPTYLEIISLNIGNIHVVGGGADIFIFLSSEDVYANKMHLKPERFKISIYAGARPTPPRGTLHAPLQPYRSETRHYPEFRLSSPEATGRATFTHPILNMLRSRTGFSVRCVLN